MSDNTERWTIHVCKDCGAQAHGPGQRCAADQRRTWTPMREVEVMTRVQAYRELLADEKAIERAARHLYEEFSEDDWPYTVAAESFRQQARAVLRDACEVDG